MTVTDVVPAGLTPISPIGTANGWSCAISGQTLTCTRSDALAAAASYPAIALSVNVANNAPASVINTASVSGGGELNTANNAASDPTPITQVADLMISKTHTGDFAAGDVGRTYTITVSNTGSGPTAGSVTVIDSVPAGLTPTAPNVVVAGWSCSIFGQTVVCTRSDVLAAGSSYPPITLTVNVANNAAASVINRVSVSGGGEINTANNTASDPTTVIISKVGDVDGNGTYDALTDGLLTIRYLFGLTGSSLTSGAVAAGAGRPTAPEVVQYLDSIRAKLDIDGNGTADALTDGLMLLRYLFGLRGPALIVDAVAIGAPRSTAAQIEAYIQTLLP